MFPSRARRRYNRSRFPSRARGRLPIDQRWPDLSCRPGANRDGGRDRTPPKKKLYIETVGCQMNVLDSELVVARLRQDGYELTGDIDQADTILYNTCSVRQHAEDKVYSALGRIKNIKESRPDVAIGVLGCMAQKDQKMILKQGAPRRHRRRPRAAREGPGTARRGQEGREAAAGRQPGQERRPEGRRDGELRRVRPAPRPRDAAEPVPGVRPDHDGVRQVLHLLRRPLGPRARAGPADPARSSPRRRQLVDQGVKEITLLGQTVNSYKFRRRRTGGSPGSRTSSNGSTTIDGLWRIKFVTNFPNDMTDDLLQAVRDLPKVARYLHVPAQSGCDDVLKRMKRLYTVALYDDMMGRIRETIPGRRRLQRLHRRLLRRDRGELREVDPPGRAVAVQEQLHLQVQPADRDEGR